MNIEVNVLNDIADNIIYETENLKTALETLERAFFKVLFVINREDIFVAALTDADVRRAILAGALLESPISQVANYHPKYMKYDDVNLAKQFLENVTALPVIDENGKIVKIYTRAYKRPIGDIDKLNLPVVIMAGGKGTRLYPYTKILPKPLIPIADIPISERIIQMFQKMGCDEFHMIVNYKKSMIKAYFNDIDCQYNLKFWDETEPLGTGGGLIFLRDSISSTFILTNCDIIILDDVRKIVKHHREAGNKVTMVCSLKNYEIPYGIVKFSEGGDIKSFEEKPKMSFFTNTGYYILEKDVFKYIGDAEKADMPEIIEKMRQSGEKVGIYPIGENSWLDMGQFDTMDSMEIKIKGMNMCLWDA